ncbi:MAG: hypothetical protein Kow0026_07900 [Oricola sp.]
MADATNRKLDVGNTEEDRISRDDPLYELSQIIGYSDPRDEEDVASAEDDGQMDLEDTLLRELEDFASSAEEDLSDAAAEYDAAVEAGSAAGPAEEFAAPEVVSAESGEDFAVTASHAPGPVEEAAPDTLEAELMDLLGGLGDKAGAAWTHESTAEEQMAPVADPTQAETDTEEADAFQSEPEEAVAEAYAERDRSDAGGVVPDVDDAGSPQVPAAAPVWFDRDEPEEHDFEPHAGSGSEEDSEILDAFESALSENLALSFEDERDAAAGPAPEEADPADEAGQSLEFDLEFEEHVEETAEIEAQAAYAADHADDAYVDEVEAVADEISSQVAPTAPPVLDTADMSASDMEQMEPLDLPELPEVEEAGAAAVDIERELDAALSGYDSYSSARENDEPEMRAAATAAAAADTRLDFDMGAFEDDLARDLEFVSHDREVREGGAEQVAEETLEDVAVAEADVRKPKRGMMIAAVVGGIAIVGAIGAFSLTSRDGGDAGGPVLVKADPEPTKIVPEDPGGKEVPNQDRAVYGEVDGNGETSPTQETLVTTSEEPIDLGGTGETVLPNGMTETAKVEDRLTPDMTDTAAPEAAETGAAVLAPRRVRTVIVRPDGTLVENNAEPEARAEVASGAPASEPAATDEPVRRIDMAASAPRAEEATGEPVAEAAAPAEEVPPATEEAATTEQLAALAEPEVAATRDNAAETQPETVVREPLRAPSVIPERPANQPVTIVGGEQAQPSRQVAAVAPQQQAEPPAQPAPQQAVPAGAYTVQIASQPSAELARKSAADLSRVYANLIGNRQVAIQQAEIEGRGTYHRVRIVANSRQDAVALCERIKQEGGSCFVAR